MRWVESVGIAFLAMSCTPRASDDSGAPSCPAAQPAPPAGELTTDSLVYWNEGGFSPDRFTALPTVGAAGVATRLEP